MTHASAKDGVQLYYESHGEGEAIIFVHEFAADHRSWDLQVRHFSRRYRCITFAARGYAPSDIPAAASSYSQEQAADDIKAVLDHAGVKRAHIVGLSMGGYATLHFGFRHPDTAISLCIGGCGYGSVEGAGARFANEAHDIARAIETQGMAVFAQSYGNGPTRVQFRRKDPLGFAAFIEALATYSPVGLANTQMGVQGTRPSLYELTAQMRALKVPSLILCGDEDVPCLAPALLMKSNISGAGLMMFANSGHSINQEESADYNHVVETFMGQVAAGQWPTHAIAH